MSASSLKEGALGSVRDFLIALARHVGRSRARVGWILVLTTLLIDRILGYRDFHEFGLVLVSVTLAYILLPDVGPDVDRAVGMSTVWLRDPSLLRSVIDGERLKSATQDLLRTFLTPENASAAWVFGCLPFVELQKRPENLLENVSYQIDLEPSGDRRTYQVSTALRAKRLLPQRGAPWIGVARTTDALVTAYTDPTCVLRELAPVTSDLWEELIAKGQLTGKITVGLDSWSGTFHRQSDDLVRLIFEEVPAASEGRDTTAECSFALPIETRVFPAKLASYFCRGLTEIGLTLVEPGRTLDAYVSLAGGPDLRPEDERTRNVHRGETGSLKWHRISTKPDALLWPGSGVVFIWS